VRARALSFPTSGRGGRASVRRAGGEESAQTTSTNSNNYNREKEWFPMTTENNKSVHDLTRARTPRTTTRAATHPGVASSVVRAFAGCHRRLRRERLHAAARPVVEGLEARALYSTTFSVTNTLDSAGGVVDLTNRGFRMSYGEFGRT
jgi:hypothetical protein